MSDNRFHTIGKLEYEKKPVGEITIASPVIRMANYNHTTIKLSDILRPYEGEIVEISIRRAKMSFDEEEDGSKPRS